MTLLYDWLKKAAKAQGNNKAVVYRDNYLSWRGLLHRVDRRAQEFKSMGIKEGAWVGLVFRRDFPFFGRLHERLLRPSAERPYPFNMAGIAEPSTGRRSMTHKKP